MPPLCAALPGLHASLTHLDLSFNDLGDAALAKLCEVCFVRLSLFWMKYHSHLKHTIFCSTGPSQTQGLIRNETIRHLDLSHNKLGMAPNMPSALPSSALGRGNASTGSLIAELISRHRGISHLNLGVNPALGRDGCSEVCFNSSRKTDWIPVDYLFHDNTIASPRFARPCLWSPILSPLVFCVVVRMTRLPSIVVGAGDLGGKVFYCCC